jgi:hypothetical protein
MSMIYRMIFGDLKMRHTKWGAGATSCGLLFPGKRSVSGILSEFRFGGKRCVCFGKYSQCWFWFLVGSTYVRHHEPFRWFTAVGGGQGRSGGEGERWEPCNSGRAGQAR